MATALLSLALAPLAAEAQTGGAGAPTGEASTSGGAGLVFSSPMRSGRRHLVRTWALRQRHRLGETLRPGTIGVAHRTLPCGTTLKINYHGHSLVTKVIDAAPIRRATISTSRMAPASHWASKA